MIKKALFIAIFVVSLGFVLTPEVFAAEFDIHQQIGIDNTPPTVPLGVSTTPVAATQIDITWSSSTDDYVGMDGYQIFRDNVQIATTSELVTSYSDSGLSASTTYSYNVTAFDIFLNISARSATSSTTTLPAPVPPTPTTTPATPESNRSGGNGPLYGQSSQDFLISEVEVETTSNSAEIAFFTAGFSVASVAYGTTPQYELGSSAGALFRQRHRFPLTDLESGVRYYFLISAQNQDGDIVTYSGEFVTKTVEDTVPPANVSEFTTYIEGNDVVMSWKNPTEPDFDRVRVIANSRFFPLDMADGLLLYEGNGQNYRHVGVYPNDTVMYYTIFAVDESGNRSSGAISFVTWGEADQVPYEPYVEPNLVSTSTPEQGRKEPISFSDIEFIQDAKIHQGYQELVSLDPALPFTIRVPYEAFDENLKTITVSIVHPNNGSLTYSFLLRVNEPKTYYEATIESLNTKAQFPFELTVLNFKLKTVAVTEGTISTVPETEQTYPLPKPTFKEHLIFLIFDFWWGWILLLILLIVTYRLLREESPSSYRRER